MLRNYLKIAVRNLSRHKLFSFINIFGLALSMSICLLVITHVKEQLSYDQFHEHVGRNYRVTTELTNKEGAAFRFANSPLPLADVLRNDYDFIENTTRLYAVGSDNATAGKEELNIRTVFTEPSFFDVFSFKLAAGSVQTALQQPNSIVLSAPAAERFFGRANPVGQTLKLKRLGNYQVTGVLQQAGKSHIDYEAYLSMSSVPLLEKTGALSPALTNWNNSGNTYTYVLLKQGSSKKQLNAALKNVAGGLMKKAPVEGKENLIYEAQPFNKIILGEELINSIGNVGSRGKMLSEIVIGLIILLSACFNYTNLSIARSLNRGKEVGIRKVAGAFRYQLFYQFIVESVVIAFLALALAGLILKLMIDFAPFINEIGRPDLSFNNSVYGWFVLFTLFTGFVAGALPAWVLSSFKPVEVLKNLSNIKLFGSNYFRKGLIVLQFTLALVIIIFTSISSRQFQFLATADPGYDRDNLLVIPLQGTDPRLVSAEVGRLTGVMNTAAVSAMPGRNPSGHSLIKLHPGATPVQMDYYDVDKNFTTVLQLKVVAGKPPVSGAENPANTIMLNEKALSVLKFKTPVDAIGKTIYLDDTAAVQIAGVLKDFHYQGLAVPVRPLLLRHRPEGYNLLAVKTNTKSSALKQQVEAALKNNYSNVVFSTTWFDEDLYNRQAATGTVSMLAFLAFMSVTIACLGLLGMVIYNTETRRKEIGIRKVMGASVAAIIALLSKGFLKLVVIAGLIAIPIGAICGFMFLNIFASRINIGLATMVFSFLGLLVLVLLTIGSQIYKVATTNPVKSLRTE